MDNPLLDPESIQARILYFLDLVLTIIFAIEMILKVIAQGFYFNGKDSYFSSHWNKLDFSIVFFSAFSLIPTSVWDFSVIKIFRLVRVLRPLRMLSKNEHLRIAISSLLNSIPQMLDVMAVAVINVIILSIMGLFIFMGVYKECLTP